MVSAQVVLRAVHVNHVSTVHIATPEAHAAFVQVAKYHTAQVTVILNQEPYHAKAELNIAAKRSLMKMRNPFKLLIIPQQRLKAKL